MTETIAAIKRRGTGLNDLLDSYDPATPEQEGVVATVGENLFAGLLEKYVGCLDKYVEGIRYENYKLVQEHLQGTILAPEEINAFLLITIGYESHKHYSDCTGMFITALLQNSYDSGHNNFTLRTKGLTNYLRRLGYKLTATKEKPISVTVEGDGGYGCGSYSTNCIFSIDGDGGYRCGKDATNSTFIINGNGGEDCGYRSANSTFIINGDVGDWCGYGSINSTYKTYGRNTLKKLLKELSYEHTIIFIKPDGKEKEYGRFSPTRILYNLGLIKC